MIIPTLEEFRRAARERRVIPLYRRFLVDGETAIGLYQKLARNRPGSYLLESAEQGVWSRYSFIGVRAAAVLTEVDGEASWSGRRPEFLPAGGDPLQAVRDTLRLLHTPRDEQLPPFTSGLVGYLSYDAVRRVERLPDSNPKDLDIPELAFVLASDLVVVDHHRSEVWLVANAINYDDSDERVDEAYADAAARVEEMTRLLAEPAAVVGGRGPARPRAAGPPAAQFGGVPGGGGGGGGGDQGRRGLPDRGQSAVRGRHHRRRPRHLPGAAADQPEPVHVPAPTRGRPGPSASTSSAPHRRPWSP